MKDYVKVTFSVFSKIRSFLAAIMASGQNNHAAVPRKFYKSHYTFTGSNNELAVSGTAEKSTFIIEGTNNKVSLNNIKLTNTIISLTGANNRFYCEEGVILTDSVITIRGNACTISIGKASTFGGVRIISVGQENQVSIGAGCLFSDHIEIWASDTHPLYNDKEEIINPEKPISIGDDVWVGARAIILKGVTIESGSVVGMGSLVVNNVPKSSITVGNPNRIVKQNISWARHY